ncbi:glycosyl hydrolase [bacterium]
MGKRVAKIFAMISVAVFASAAAGHTDDFEKEFRFPEAKYGSAPFWSWNEVLEPEELIHQIDEFAEQGMGGFFMHAREGLISEYMGSEWMEAVKISVKRAKENGLIAYMYDEDRWPSGFASGKVPRMNDAFKQKAMIVIKRKEPMTPEQVEEAGKLVRVFSVEFADKNIVSMEKIKTEAGEGIPADATSDGKVLLYFLLATAEAKEWFNGETYVDTMNPDATDAFIQVTHEVYKEAIGEEFGKTSLAIFTDEPEYKSGRHFNYPTLPWTPALPGVFEEKYDYSVEDMLPYLFYKGDKSPKARLDFRTVATEMFRDAFAKPIFDWGEKNNVQLTGHYMLEDTLSSQINRIGAAMPHYEYMQFPGMDHLGRNINDLLTAKQVSSVAHQFSRPLILTETYGCSGWNLSFENMKWMSDWHYALGVNFMNQHLSWYSMRGARKRDYPATLMYQSPWWKYHKMIADYLRRATYATAQGDFVAETLVLHPITAAWTVYSPLDTSGADKLYGTFNNLLYTLTGSQVDYDLGDEIIISRHGSVSDGKFIVKDMAYTTVVIPETGVLRSETLALLEHFIGQGGVVVAQGGNEYSADADKQHVLEGSVVATDADNVVEKLLPNLARHVDVKNESGDTMKNLFLHQRDIDGSTFIFIANTDQENGIDVEAVLPYTGRVTEWNLFDGTNDVFPCQIYDGKMTAELHFEPAGSVLISIDPEGNPARVIRGVPKLVRTQAVQDIWEIVSRGPNALTIDLLRYQREGDKSMMPVMPHLAAQDSMQSKGTDFPFRVRYKFTLGVDPSSLGDLKLVMEQPEKMKISINGKGIEYQDEGWWIDRSFKKVSAAGYMKKGKNTLQLHGIFKHPKKPDTRIYVRDGVEIESIYITGNFSVNKTKTGKFVIERPNDTFRYGDMAEQGYPFYSGSMVIRKEIHVNEKPGEKVFLEIDGLEAITTKVRINGKDAGVIAFHPHRIEITDLVKDGSDTIEIELTNSNRNLLGPHHTEVREPLSVGPGTFKSEIFKTHYNFIPYGITGGVNIAYYK